MSVGVETNGLRDMAFRAIGDLAVEVLENAKTAAHADKLRNKFEAAQPGGTEPPIAQATGEGTEASNGRKSPRREAPAVQSQGLGKGTRTKVTRAEYAPALVLVIDNGLRGAHLPPRKGIPVPASRSPLLIVVGGTHAATDHSLAAALASSSVGRRNI